MSFPISITVKKKYDLKAGLRMGSLRIYSFEVQNIHFAGETNNQAWLETWHNLPYQISTAEKTAVFYTHNHYCIFSSSWNHYVYQ